MPFPFRLKAQFVNALDVLAVFFGKSWNRLTRRIQDFHADLTLGGINVYFQPAAYQFERLSRHGARLTVSRQRYKTIKAQVGEPDGHLVFFILVTLVHATIVEPVAILPGDGLRKGLLHLRRGGGGRARHHLGGGDGQPFHSAFRLLSDQDPVLRT